MSKLLPGMGIQTN